MSAAALATPSPRRSQNLNNLVREANSAFWRCFFDEFPFPDRFSPRLYIAPVESDTKGLPPPTVPASSRSSIRRLRHRGSDVARESRRRALYAAAVYHPAEGAEPWSRRSRSTSHEPRAAPSTSNPGSDTNGPGLSPAYIRGYQRAVEFQRRQVARPDGPDGDMPANTEVLIRVLTGPPDGPPRLSPLQAAPAPPTSGDLARSANDAYTESAPSGRLGLSAYETWDPEGVVPRRAPAPQPEVSPVPPTRCCRLDRVLTVNP